MTFYLKLYVELHKSLVFGAWPTELNLLGALLFPYLYLLPVTLLKNKNLWFQGFTEALVSLEVK